jgi:TonB family protein
MRQFNRLLVASFLVAVSVGGIVHAQTSEPLIVTSSAPASPMYVVTPTFPEEVEVPADGVSVQAVGTVRVDGSFVLHRASAPPGFEPLAAAVAAVIGKWHFSPAFNRELCAPAETEIEQVVLFQGSPAAPRISVARHKRPERSVPGGVTRVKEVEQPSYIYPVDAYRDGIEGRVVAVFVVEPGGAVKNPKVWMSSPPGVFDLAVMDQIGKTRVHWSDPEPKQALCTRQTIDFCIAGGRPEHPFPACHP